MPLILIGAVLVIYGMAYIVFAFVDPPSTFAYLFQSPLPVSYQRLGRGLTGAVLFVVPLLVAYVMLRR